MIIPLLVREVRIQCRIQTTRSYASHKFMNLIVRYSAIVVDVRISGQSVEKERLERVHGHQSTKTNLEQNQ